VPLSALAIAAYATMSAVTALAYALDKRAARRGGRRTAEATLHALELLGGWPGAFIAQRVIRHKNAKPAYQAVFWAIGIAHAAAWAAILRR
jgi:uncharacterized membrane protein YsdA (DUF1294 family)